MAWGARRSTLLWITLAVGCFSVFGPMAVLVVSNARASREVRRRNECTNNLKSIGIAIQDYHNIIGVLPSAFMTDVNGKPAHSWRISIVQYMMSTRWWHLYDFSSPWDSPGNLRLVNAAQMPDFDCSSNATSNPRQLADYVMIVGDEAAIQPGKWTRMAELDDLANTVLVAEIANSDIFWAEPRDLNFATMSFRINDPAGNCISSRHPGGANVLMADGSVRFLHSDTDRAVVQALCTRDASDNSIPYVQ